MIKHLSSLWLFKQSGVEYSRDTFFDLFLYFFTIANLPSWNAFLFFSDLFIKLLNAH